MWITDIINKNNNKVYKTNKEALEDIIKLISEWAKSNEVNVYMYHNAHGTKCKSCNRIISIITQSNKGYEYKLTIHRLSDGYMPSLKRLYNSGYSYNKKEYLNIAFKFYDDDPA